MLTVSASPIPEELVPAHRVHFSAIDALEPPPPLEWCVEGLFPRPSISILVGDPGSKKTFTVIDLAVCVALGKPWLGMATGSNTKELQRNEPALSQTPAEQGEGVGVLFIDEQTRSPPAACSLQRLPKRPQRLRRYAAPYPLLGWSQLAR